MRSDNRVTVSFQNQAPFEQDVTIDGHTYAILAKHVLLIKANPGTVVYAASSFGRHRRGQELLRMDASCDQQSIDML